MLWKKWAWLLLLTALFLPTLSLIFPRESTMPRPIVTLTMAIQFRIAASIA